MRKFAHWAALVQAGSEPRGRERRERNDRRSIRDLTRPVTLDVTYLGCGPDPWGGTRIALAATTQLARRDYEMTWNMGLPGGSVLVGPTLQIDLEIQAVRQDE